jgi:cyanophycinase
VSTRSKGRLFIIGGHEDREGERTILRAICRDITQGDRRLAIVTAATGHPADVAREYTAVFQDLGVTAIDVLDVRNREDACDASVVHMLAEAAVVFFTGGDQLRITSHIGGSPLCECLHDLYRKGHTIAGTSAGAAAMPDTMMIWGSSDASYQSGGLGMAPGLGLIKDVVIDTHFAERGRMGRLLGAVAQNPRNLGIGIDEDTALLVEPNGMGTVVGSGAVYFVDGRHITYSSLAECRATDVVGIHDVILHVLVDGDQYDLAKHTALVPED